MKQQQERKPDARTGSNLLKFAGAFIACLVGSGFATGQEIMQYFTAYGLQGLLTAAVMLLLFLYVGGEFITAGYREKFERGSQIFSYFCGKTVGGFYDCFTVLFVFMSYVVMVSGAGATLHQNYGLPTWIGSVLLMLLAGGTVIFGLGKIVDVIGRIGPAIVCIAMAVSIAALLKSSTGLAEGVSLLRSGEVTVLRAGTGWLSAAVSYVGFCMLWLAGFLAALGTRAHSAKEARGGAAIGAIGFTLGCVLMMLGLLANIREVTSAQIPALILAAKLHPVFASCFSVIILAGIYTAAVPLLWQTSARFAAEGTSRFRLYTVALAAAGGALGLVLPFAKLINIVYVASGYIGSLLLPFMLVKTIRRRISRKER